MLFGPGRTDAELCLARTRQPVLEQMREAGLVEAIGEQRIFETVTSAVERPRATPEPTVA
jgi:hypothetical protein